MIRHQMRTGRTVLRPIHGSVRTGKDTHSVSPVEEVVQLLDRLPRINGEGHYMLDLATRLTFNDVERVIHQLESMNPGMVDILEGLGYWFPGSKYHARHAFVCLAGAVAASTEPVKLHRLE